MKHTQHYVRYKPTIIGQTWTGVLTHTHATVSHFNELVLQKAVINVPLNL